MGLVPSSLPAQTNTSRSATSNRVLLIVDTSRPMQRRATATLKVVQDLITSGLNSQLRAGDSLGLWTFNETLQSGRFPLQTWSPDARWEIAGRVQTFLKAQKFEKQPKFDPVLSALAHLIERSPRLTVILITSGEEKIHGTPFDASIAQFYQQWRDQQQKARMPFVTVFRAQNGRLVDFALNTPPWPLQMPAPPKDAQPAEAVPKKPEQAAQSSQPASSPPLIVVGKKPKPAEAPARQSPPTKAATQLPAVATAAPTTGSVATARSPTPAPPSATASTAPAATSPPPAPAAQPPSPPTPPPPLPVESKPAPAKAAPPIPADTAPPKPKAETPSPPVPALQPKPALTSPPPAATPAVPQPAAPVSARPSPSTQAGGATPADAPVSFNLLWLALPLAAALLAALIMLRAHRARSASQASLITRSYERGKKP